MARLKVVPSQVGCMLEARSGKSDISNSSNKLFRLLADHCKLSFMTSPSMPWQHGRWQQGRYIGVILRKQLT